MPRVSGDIASERFILASLAQGGLQRYLDISHIISDDCFFDDQNKAIFQIMKSGINRLEKLDINTFLAEAHSLGLSPILERKENQQYVKTLFHTPIHIENITKVAAKLKKLAIVHHAQCELEETHRELTRITGNESIDEISSIIERPLNCIQTLENEDSAPINIFSIADQHITDLLTNPCDQVGISTGYSIYDFMIGGGLRDGYINLVVARPKAGKSQFGMNVAMNISEQDVPVLYLDTEMDPKLGLNRIISALTNVKYAQIETGKFAEQEQYIRAKLKQRKQNFFYKRIAGRQFDEVLSIIRAWVHKHKTERCVVIYDYFKLMDTKDMDNLSEYQALGFQLSKFTDYLGNNQVACLAFVQANRDGIQKESTDIVSQSDRLLWLCSSLALLRKKTSEEVAQEGMQRGSHKLIPMDGMRFSEGLADKDWINLSMDNFKLYELGTNQNPRVKSTFNTTDDQDANTNSG